MTKKIKSPKMAKKQPQGDYPVGYAKTPEHSRFKVGNEFGKKGGRPKGRKNNATLLREILESKIEITAPDGVKKRVTMIEAATWQNLKKALSGDARAYAEVMRLAGQVGIETHAPSAPNEELAADEAATLALFHQAMEAEVLAKHGLPAATPPAPDDGSPAVVSYPDRPTVRRVNFGPRPPESPQARRAR